MKTWQIAALIGTIIFILAAPLPLMSIQIFGTVYVSGTVYRSLADIYGSLGQTAPSQDGTIQWSSTLAAIEVSLWTLMILFPITSILGLVSVATTRPILAVVSGVLGIVCWSAAVFTVVQLQALVASIYGQLVQISIQVGFGVYVGILGALMLLASYFIARREQARVVFAPTPPPTAPSVETPAPSPETPPGQTG